MTAETDKVMGFILANMRYDPATGKVTWKTDRGNQAKAGDEVGGADKRGYKRTVLQSGTMLIHRAAWLLHYGEWPSEMVDHINGDPSDNRICNLRAVSHSKNQQNRVAPRTDNKSGFMGVSIDRGRFVARIMVNKRKLSIGSFGTAEEAHEAYMRVKKELHINFDARLKQPVEFTQLTRRAE